MPPESGSLKLVRACPSAGPSRLAQVFQGGRLRVSDEHARLVNCASLAKLAAIQPVGCLQLEEIIQRLLLSLPAKPQRLARLQITYHRQELAFHCVSRPGSR